MACLDNSAPAAPRCGEVLGARKNEAGGMAMATIESLFATKIYRAEVQGAAGRRLLADLERACRSIRDDDGAGQAWCETKGYPGYTSYASLDDLPLRFPEFADLVAVIEPHIAAFGRDLDLDLDGKKLTLDSMWINVLPAGGFHAAHIHPHSVVSGTYYVAVPKGSAALKLEDPRLAMMMAAPPRKEKARLENRTFVSIDPKPGTLLLWESWLRHEVPLNQSRDERISVSFNYSW